MVVMNPLAELVSVFISHDTYYRNSEAGGMKPLSSERYSTHSINSK